MPAVLNETTMQARLNEAVRLWNEGRFDEATEHVADDATIVNQYGRYNSKAEAWAVLHPEPRTSETMGHVDVMTLGCRGCSDEERTSGVATLLYWWSLNVRGDKTIGYSLEVFEIRGDKIYVVQELSFTD